MAINLNGTGFITGLSSISSPTISGGSFPAGTAAAPGITLSGDSDTGLYSPGANQIAITTSGTAAVTVDASQRVGIGTQSPDRKLHVAGDWIRVDDGYGLDTSGSTEKVKLDNGYISLTTASSERARIDSSGRLLVGTSTARSIGNITAGVEIEGTTYNTSSLSLTCNTSGGDTPTINFGRSKGSSVGSNTGGLAEGDDLGYITFSAADGTDMNSRSAWILCEVDGATSGDDVPGRLVFSVTADGSGSPSEAMRINNAGELLVGYTSDNGAYKLQVNSQIFATSATIATSDGRYKENVAALDGCVDLVKALRPVSFDWKVQEPVTRVDEDGETVVVREAHNFPDGKQVGFIAQEVEEVLADKPWLGSVIKQNVRPAVTDADGNELAPEEEFLGIAEGNLVAVLTSALKDAIGEIESLKARVAALESV